MTEWRDRLYDFCKLIKQVISFISRLLCKMINGFGFVVAILPLSDTFHNNIEDDNEKKKEK